MKDILFSVNVLIDSLLNKRQTIPMFRYLKMIKGIPIHSYDTLSEIMMTETLTLKCHCNGEHIVGEYSHLNGMCFFFLA